MMDAQPSFLTPWLLMYDPYMRPGVAKGRGGQPLPPTRCSGSTSMTQVPRGPQCERYRCTHPAPTLYALLHSSSPDLLLFS